MSTLPLPPPGRVTLTDGAWGTEFQRRGLPVGSPADLWNLTHPDEVRAVAASYVAAGSKVILTNTFRANPVALAALGAADQTAVINRRGVELSRAAAGADTLVFASLGPTGKLLATGDIDADGVTAAFRAQAEALASAGPDTLLLETFSDVEEARLAVRAAKATGLPVVVSFAFDAGKQKDRTMTGATPEAVARAMAEEGADAVGANCGTGPASYVEVCRRLKAACDLPVWVKPNAGLPTLRDGQAVYSMGADEFAAYLPALVAAGASFVGGCCGTSPAYIARLARSLPSCASS